MRRFRHFWISLLVFAASLFLFVARVEASDGLRGNECVVLSDEIITHDFYFFCNTLVVYGYIDGDLIGFGSEVTIAREGVVTGDIWVAGGQLTIEGVVGDDVHFLGLDLDIGGLARFPNPRTDIISAALSVEIARQVIIPGDVIFFGYQAIINGRVNGNVDFQGQSLIIRNDIAGDVYAIVGDQEGNRPISRLPLIYSVDFRQPGLYFTTGSNDPIGYINGNLSYEAPQQIRAQDYVGGSIRFTQSIARSNITEAQRPTTFLQIVADYILTSVRDVAALGLIGMLALNLLSNLVLEPSYRVQTQPISAFSWGVIIFLISLAAAPLLVFASLIVLLLVTIITISELTLLIGLILVVLNLGFLSGIFFLFWFMGRTIASFVIGYFVLRLIQRVWLRYDRDPPNILGEVWFALIIGLIIVSAVVNLPLGPFIGGMQLMLSLVIASAGLGAFFMYFRDLWYQSGRQFTPMRGDMRRAIPPPPEDHELDLDLPIGMDNLPPGFTGFDRERD